MIFTNFHKNFHVHSLNFSVEIGNALYEINIHVHISQFTQQIPIEFRNSIKKYRNYIHQLNRIILPLLALGQIFFYFKLKLN